MDAIDYLAAPQKHSVEAVCVLYGDEGLLKRHVLAELRTQVLGEDDGDFSLTSFAGGTATLRDVMDELSTFAMFGAGRRMVVVDEADEFVSRNRSAIEDYVASPRTSAVLVLDVKSWPSNTRLFKAVDKSGLQVECKFPSPAKLQKWLLAWAKKQHHVVLEPEAAQALAESVEPELGLVDQELAKLAATVGMQGTVTAALVREVVGGWRVRTAWEMLDAALDGQTSEALVQLDRLLLSGEVPIAILAQIGATLRRFAAATRIVADQETSGRRPQLRQALEEAGFRSFVLSKAESQLRRLGRARAGQIYRWLLDADLALKGASSSPPRARMVLEQLMVRLSAPVPAPQAAARSR